MLATSITSTATGTSTTGTGTSATGTSSIGSKSVFLKLLVAQMKYQNPLKPQNATQMSSQLAQFNMVDQQTTTNTLLQKLVSAGSSTPASTTNDASYLGKTVTARQNQMQFTGAAQTFSVVTNAPASQARVTVLNSTGTPVRTMTMNNLAAGANSVTWDGSTDVGGTAPSGTYTIQVSSTDLQGTKVTSHIEQTGVVNAVRFTTNGTQLVVGGVPVLPANITEIKL